MKNVTRYFQHDQTNQPRVSLLIMGKFRHTWPHAFNNFFFWASIYLQKWTILPAGNYMFKVNKRKIQALSQIALVQWTCFILTCH